MKERKTKRNKAIRLANRNKVSAIKIRKSLTWITLVSRIESYYLIRKDKHKIDEEAKHKLLP